MHRWDWRARIRTAGMRCAAFRNAAQAQLRFVEHGEVGFEVSHSKRKDKDALRMGHPWIVLREEKATPHERSWGLWSAAGWGSRYPTLSAKTRTRLEWGTLRLC